MSKEDTPKTVEQRLAEWTAQDPAVCQVRPAEWMFIKLMRASADMGVGYGWMQQVIEWEWQSKNPIGAWGPESHERELQSARKDERERCAKVCEGLGPKMIEWWGEGQANAGAQECAATIRALEEEGRG